MANIRLALLFTLSLVAMIAPAMGVCSLYECLLGPKTILDQKDELLAKLAAAELPAQEVRSILKSLLAIDADAKVGLMRVDDLLSGWSNILRQGHCSRTLILYNFEGIMSLELNSVLNVCKAADPNWMSYCKQNIIQVHNDSQRLDNLGREELGAEQIGEILRSIEDKRDTKIELTSVQSLLDQAPVLKVDICQPNALEERVSYTNNGNAILVSNLKKFDQVLSTELLPFCAQRIRPVFEKSTASITDEVKKRIRNSASRLAASHVLDTRQREEVGRTLDKEGIVDSCKQVKRSIENVHFIKRQAGTKLSDESLDKLLNDKWKELGNTCYYLLECYVEGKYWDYVKNEICLQKSGGKEFTESL